MVVRKQANEYEAFDALDYGKESLKGRFFA